MPFVSDWMKSDCQASVYNTQKMCGGCPLEAVATAAAQKKWDEFLAPENRIQMFTPPYTEG